MQPLADRKSKAPYLIHPSPQDHEERIEELQIFVAVVNPDCVCCACVDSVDITDKRVLTEEDSINISVNHPSIQRYLAGVVDDHCFL